MNKYLPILTNKYFIIAALALVTYLGYSWYTDGKYDPNANYIGNKSSYKFHKIKCRYAKKTMETNRFYAVTREKLINKGMRPAGCCKP